MRIPPRPARWRTRLGLVAALLTSASMPVAAQPSAPAAARVLVFSKTAGFRHTSIEPGIAAVRRLGASNGFAVDATEDATAFTDHNLRRYRAIVFLNTTGDVLNEPQQDVLERYIQAGGGWVGVHAATDTEYGWPWYNHLAGAYFASHPNDPNVRRGAFRVRDRSHASVQGLPDRWEREDEFYNFRSIDSSLRVLVDVDETSYQGGTNGANHPMTWYHEVDGGRAWYTAMGHTDASYEDPLFLGHLLGGIRYAMGTGALDYARARPEENRFTKVVLATPLNEPVELAVLPDERVLLVERGGAVKLYRPASGQVTEIARIPVSLTYTGGERAEDGLLGLAADPAFATNGHVYLYYSPAGDAPKNVLARFTMRGDSLDLASRRVLLEVMVQRDQCCHTGGSIAFDARGNLYLSTGDNTNPFATGYAPIDERADRMPWDAQRSSGNTNDLRGKILRIHPEPDGSYTIPEGNLFPRGTPLTRPEIYTMGHRNPYRIAIDRRTGFLYWGDVGPDAPADSAERGPAGHDEVNQARTAGNFGWPYFVGDNKAYFDVDAATMRAGLRFDAARPINDSPNNTGRRELPPAQPAFIWYPSGPSSDFPIVNTGGRTAMAGPVYHRDDFARAARPFPAWYDGRLLTYDWMRGWILAATLAPNGDLARLERFMPSHTFSNPIDMEFGPNGDLYVLEYGTAWFQGNDDARLVRIEYNAGNRAPQVFASVDRPAGAVPHRVRLTAAGTTDADGDSLGYAWTVTRANGSVVQRLRGADAALTLTAPGTYVATLEVSDPQGARNTARVEIVAGNAPPVVALDVRGGNRSFFFPGTPVEYAVGVTDREDGSLARGTIPASRVRVTADYLASAPPPPAPGHRAAGAPPPHAEGRRLIEAGTCLSCHQYDRASIGPSYTAVAERYRTDTTATATLVRKIRGGGAGVWGSIMMPPHPQLTDAEAALMVGYIRSLGQRASEVASLPPRGTYAPPDSAMARPDGAVLLRATYTDRGAPGLPGASAESTLVLRAPLTVVAKGTLSPGASKMTVEGVPVEVTLGNRSGASVGLGRIDLTGLTAVTFAALAPAQYGAAGGVVEVRADSATGALLGTSAPVAPTQTMGAPAQVRATLTPTSGERALFLVFRNAEVPGERFLFALLTARFER